MMPMCIGDATFQASAAEKPHEAALKTASAAPRGIVPTELSCLRDVRVSSRTRRTRVLTTSGETAGDTAVDEMVTNPTQGDYESKHQEQRGKIQRPFGRSTTEPSPYTTWARRY